MRKKVRRILTFLLALAVAMSVMTGMALSAPAESEPEATPAAADVAVEEKQTDATDSTNQAEPEEDADKDAPAEEDSSEDGEAPVEGDPEEPAPDSKKPAGEAGEAASVSAASEQIATVGSGDRAVTVRTSAAAGVLPEGAKLVVKQLADTDSQYQDAANTLDANQVAYDNFLALDVGFEVNGQEVEPNGSVDVQFELGAGLLPEEADTESLAIQHLADSGKVETVADTGSATNGTVAVQEQKINAEFTVDSFSYFTITYNSGSSIRAYCVDADGNHIPGANNVKLSDADQTIRDGNWHSVADLAPAIEGYDYSRAYVQDDGNQEAVSHIKYRSSSGTKWRYINNSNPSQDAKGSGFSTAIYLVYERPGQLTIHHVDENGNQLLPPTTEATPAIGSTTTFSSYQKTISGYTYWRACYGEANGAEVTTMTRNNNDYTYKNGDVTLTRGNNNQPAINKLTDIYLVYVKNGGDPTPGETTGDGDKTVTPGMTKQAVLKGDDTYDLSLSVTGSIGSSTRKALVDVIYVLDVSGSMKYNMNSNNGSGNERLNQATSAIKTMTNSLAGNEVIDARFALVTFSDTAATRQGWTKTASTLTNNLPTNANGGTNYQAGLVQAKELLTSARKDPKATTVVIFLSDGDPTYYNDSSSDGIGGTGNSDTDGRAMSKARGVVKTMTPNYFFTVGVGPASNYSELQKLTGAAHSGVETANYAGTDTNSLKSAFDDMQGQITSIACENVSISHTLSENVQMVMNGSSPKSLTAKVTDKNGTQVGTYNADGTVTLPATELNGMTTLPAPTFANGTITWDFPDTYKLEGDYTYTVTANIDATEKAYEKYRTGGYTDTADAGTGTHASAKGFFSNATDQATLSYDAGEGVKTAKYAKPVIQLKPGKLIIEKSVTGLTETEIASLKQNLTFTYTLNDGTAQTVKLSDFTLSNGKYTYEAASGLSPNTKYSVSESGADVDGYELTATNTNTSGTIAKGATATASFTNSYELSDRTITLKKVVGGSMGDPNKEFTFSASSNATLGDSTLKHNETTTITAKVGEEVIISESDYTGDGYATTANGVEGGTYNNHTYTFTVTKDMSEATVITFTNTKDVTPPMGVKHNAVPYAIMVGIAAAAGVSYVLVRRRRDSE